MTYKITSLPLPLGYGENDITHAVCGVMDILPEHIASTRLYERKLETKNKDNIFYKLTVIVELSASCPYVLRHKDKTVSVYSEPRYIIPKALPKSSPVVVGMGPAGLFAALTLVRAGAAPIILERGDDVDVREKKVNAMQKCGVLATESNVQFGEGGAGAFSDGKLKPGAMDEIRTFVMTELVKAGAPEQILYEGKPHVGTDKLCQTVKNMRREIISLGGRVLFRAKFQRFITKNGKICAAVYTQNGEEHTVETEHIILAIGHSARDTVKKLIESGLSAEARPFGIGVRIEHPQKLINKLCYGRFAGHPTLGAADYKLVTHLPNGRSVYSFCMCPGGYVVAATSEENCVVTNGMSLFARDGENANSALLVSVTPDDFQNDVLKGIQLQRQIENAAFKSAGATYAAPSIRLCDFLQKVSPFSLGSVKPTYAPCVSLVPPEEYLPDFITESLRASIDEFEAWMPGYAYGDAVLTGPETRSTSPLRFLRDDSFQAVGIKGLYPCGEGAGYAGGIVSSAADGVKCADALLQSCM